MVVIVNYNKNNNNNNNSNNGANKYISQAVWMASLLIRINRHQLKQCLMKSTTQALFVITL